MLYASLAVVFVLDRLTKLAVTEQIDHGCSVSVIDNILYFNHVRNTGAAFGLLSDYIHFLIFATLVVIGITVWIYHFSPYGEFLNPFGMGLYLGGAVGNLIDRIQWGFVVDFIDFRIWPVFNVADAAIVVGVFVLIIHFYRCEPWLTRQSSDLEEVN